MMKYIGNVLLIIGLGFLIGCGEKNSDNTNSESTQKLTDQNEQGKFTIEGTVHGGKGNKVYLIQLTNQVNFIDSVVIDEDDHFKLSGKANDLTAYHVGLSDKEYVPILVKKGDHLEFSSTMEKFIASYNIENSYHSEILNDYIRFNHERVLERNKIKEELASLTANEETKRQELVDRSLQIQKEITTFQHAFIENNSESPAAVFVFNDLLPYQGMEFFDTTHLPYFVKLEQGLAKSFPNTGFHEFVSKNLDGIQNALNQMEMNQKQIEANIKLQQEIAKNGLQPGDPAPEIALPDPNGNIRKLSDLKGKVVLIDFWASWCRPCRAENPNVVRLYNKYNSKGFEIFSVSLDGTPQQRGQGKAMWQQAIQQDGLIWKNHVSELNGWSSSLMPVYKFNSIPFTVLVDKDGKVIATNLRGVSLESKLIEIFGS